MVPAAGKGQQCVGNGAYSRLKSPGKMPALNNIKRLFKCALIRQAVGALCDPVIVSGICKHQVFVIIKQYGGAGV